MSRTELPAPVKAAVLCDALPYIRRFAGARRRQVRRQRASPSSCRAHRSRPRRPTGTATSRRRGTEALQRFAEDVVLLRSIGILPVVVHGGGPQIGSLMARLGKVPEFRDGLRVTDSETLDIARMVLVGKVNRDIVGMINVHGPLAVGLSGEDAGLITATRPRPRARLRRRRRRGRPDDRAPPAGRGPRARHRHDRLGQQPARPTTSTPTPSRERSPRRSARRSSCSSPTSRASARTRPTRRPCSTSSGPTSSTRWSPPARSAKAWCPRRPPAPTPSATG